tara:strand:+ start:1052 stop:2146 length:1095 start_codon:yes stop_codon:yes gene_type:complete
MARDIVKSNIAAVAVNHGSTNAFSTSNLGLRLYMGVQDFNYSINLSRQNQKQLGTQDYSFREINNQPDVELGVSYLANSACSNEMNGGFVGESAFFTRFNNFFSGTLENSTNFYVFFDPNQSSDIFNTLTFDESLINLSGFDAIAFGNCFPATYGISYAVGTLPIVSTNYICSNVVFENITGTTMQSPAINLTGGNNNGVGLCEFEFEEQVTNDADPLVLNPADTGSTVTLQNLQVGGQPLSGVHAIQSLDMSVDLPRVPSYGLGNDYAYNRKAQLPANGRFSVSSLVSGFNEGSLTGILKNDQNYDFQLVLASGSKKLIYQIEDAKLNSYNYGMGLNEMMTLDAEFGFEVTETKGLKVSGTLY